MSQIKVGSLAILNGKVVKVVGVRLGNYEVQYKNSNRIYSVKPSNLKLFELKRD